MNPTSADPTAPPPPPPQQQQPPRSSFSCDRHPEEQFSGFCPSCLCERLTTLDHSSSNTPSSSRRPSSASAAAAAAIKSLFSSSSKSNNFPPLPPLPKPSKSTAFLPELRRTKSFSATKNEALLGLNFEPQRKSCDVRVRNTLCTLFSLEGENRISTNHEKPISSSNFAASSSHQNITKSDTSHTKNPNFIQNEEDSIEPPNVEDSIGFVDDDGDEIRPVQDSHIEGLRRSVELTLTSGEIVEEGFSLSNLKPMKDHIDLNSQEKKSGIWAAASVFSKKWQKWRTKQKDKKQSKGENSTTLPVEKPISRQFRETQSEIADYGFGRRSCDTDPRFSLDAGRISFDDARYSFDEPRASWDGHLIGRTFPKMAPMVSLMEDGPHVSRPDMKIPVEEGTRIRDSGDEDEFVPGGSSQTKEYYLDSSSSRRRKSLDRSSSIRKTAAAVVAEIDELKMGASTNAVMDTNANSLRDDLSETFELSSGIRDINSIGNGERKESKKCRKWKWKIWGFMQRRNGAKDEDDDEKYSRVNGVGRSLSSSWQERREGNGVREGLSRTMLRSNSSVSWRNASHIQAPFASARKSSAEMYENASGKKRSEFVLEKNRSARYSPNHFDNGLLRLYLTPTRAASSRRGGAGKIKPTNSQPIARSVLKLY